MTVQEQETNGQVATERHPVRGRRRRRDDLAEPAGGEELRQLGPADGPWRSCSSAPRTTTTSASSSSAAAATPSAPAPTSTCSTPSSSGTTNKSVKIAQVSARTFDRAFNLSKPTIAVVEGYAVAGGFELFDLLRLRHRRRRREDRRLPHPPRAVRRRRPDLPPPALHRPAQDQGAAAHGQAAVRQGVRGVGSGQRLALRPRSSSRRSADFVAPMLDKSAFTMRITKLAANRGLDGDTETLIALESMTCNVAHQSAGRQGGRAGVPREARAGLEARLAPVVRHDERPALAGRFASNHRHGPSPERRERWATVETRATESHAPGLRRSAHRAMVEPARTRHSETDDRWFVLRSPYLDGIPRQPLKDQAAGPAAGPRQPAAGARRG